MDDGDQIVLLLLQYFKINVKTRFLQLVLNALCLRNEKFLKLFLNTYMYD